MNPGISQGSIPPFHEIGEYDFEGMCRDLFQEESSVATCEVFGERGQGQYGIDLLAYRTEGEGREVGQCKCYSNFPPKKIRDASDKFFDNWSYWSDKGVKRFILFVACELRQRQRQEEISKQKERFADRGIIYEVWSAATIQNKLRTRPSIIYTHLANPEYWGRVICGPDVTAFSGTQYHVPGPSGILNVLLTDELERIGEFLSEDAQQQIESMRTAWREGRKDEAILWVEAIRENRARWLALSPSAKAAILRFAASLELETGGDVDRAQALANEARELMPSANESRLQALIADRRSGPEAAIDLLINQKDVDSINLKAGLLLEMGRVEECLPLLQFENACWEPNAFTFRTRALMYLLRKDLDQALIEINKALELAPNWQAINFTAAIIDYFKNLSPSILADHLIAWPDPIPWALVKRDDESLLRFQKAGKVFLQLAEQPGIEKEERQTFETWHLACLANDPDRHGEASDYCKLVLQNDPTHYRAIAWASARNLDVDLDPSERALEILVVDGSAGVPHILGLASSYLTAQKFSELTELLEKTRPVFQAGNSELLWTLWYVQSLVAKGDPQTALTTIDGSDFKAELKQARALALVSLANENGDSELLVQHLEDSYEETGNPVFLLDLCQFMIKRQEWDYVSERAAQLVRGVATDEALRLAAIGTYNASKFDLCLQLLDEYQWLFSQGKPPAQLRRIRARCLLSLGSLPQAVADAYALAQEEPTAENLFDLAQIYFAKGDFIGLTWVARQLLDHPELTLQQAFSICQWIRLENQGLARLIWRRAHDFDIPDDAVGVAIELGYQLGLDNELGPLQLRMNVLGQQGLGAIRFS